MVLMLGYLIEKTKLLLRLKASSTVTQCQSQPKETIQISQYDVSHHNEVVQLIDLCDFECGEALPTIGKVALFRGKVVGYIGASPTYGENAWVSIVVVNKAARGLGIGLGLMKAMLDEFKHRGIKRFEAYTEDDNIRALEIYAKMGLTLKKGWLIEGYTDDIDSNIK